ncbi:MAG: nucleotidyltransferase [Fimbriimonadaceae bacterium]|nr:nucleotidyltransferase [Fimbriimonadaceae bacterium]
MSRDFEDLFASLADHNVEFLVVGSTLLAFYGRPRYTEDIDLWVRRSGANLENLADALDAFGLEVDREAIRGLAQPSDQMIVLGAAPQVVDLLNDLEGLDFESAWRSRQSATLFGSNVFVLSRQDFVASKKAAGRPKDLADLALLQEVEEADSD